jgi:hypothetical protein
VGRLEFLSLIEHHTLRRRPALRGLSPRAELEQQLLIEVADAFLAIRLVRLERGQVNLRLGDQRVKPLLMTSGSVGLVSRMHHSLHASDDQPVELDGLKHPALAVLARDNQHNLATGRLSLCVNRKNPAHQPPLPVQQLEAERRRQGYTVIAVREVELTLRR